jgi:TolB-like protein
MNVGSTFTFGGFRFAVPQMDLTRNGVTVPLGSRAAEILLFLLRHAGTAVHKDALLAAIWPDRVVEENNLTVHMSALRRALGDNTADTRFIRTEPGRGYRFIGAVEEEVPDVPAPAATVGAPVVLGRGKPSIAVLPFDNLSGDPDQAFFADGMVEDVITELSRNRALSVVARGSSFSYRGRSMDIRQIAADLGVRYILEGSVRRSAARVRVNAQLIDAESGAHIWAERYDRDVGDIFAVQDEITRAASMAIGPAVSHAEQVRATRVLPAALDAWEALHRGMWYLERVDAQSNATARALFEHAIEIDPQFAQPHAWLVQTYLNDIYLFHLRDNASAVALAETHALRAVALDPNDATAHAALAWTASAAGDAVAGLARAERALTINPSHVDAHRCRTASLIWLGRLEEAREEGDLCVRLSPHDPRSWMSQHHLLMATYLMRDYVSAVEAGLRVLDAHPAASLAYRWIAAALAQMGRIDEARAVLRRAVAVVAPLPIEDFLRERGAWFTDAFYVHLQEGLCLAGWTGDTVRMS